MEIKASVGKGGINRGDDVDVVQALLNSGQNAHFIGRQTVWSQNDRCYRQVPERVS